jgi:hypothetical protein
MVANIRPRKTLNVTSAEVRVFGRFSKPLNKLYLEPIRWMGCVIAVYDCTVREKSEVKGSKAPRVKANPKRRWGRGGHRTSRKSRQLTTADPGHRPSPPHPKPSRDRTGTASAHLTKYLGRVAQDVVKFERLFKNVFDRERRSVLLSYARRRRSRFVELVSRSRGASNIVGKAHSYKVLESLGAERLPVARSFILNETNTGRLPLFWEDVLDDFNTFVKHRPDLNNPGGQGIQRFGSMAPPKGPHRDRALQLQERRLLDVRRVMEAPRLSSVRNDKRESRVPQSSACLTCGSTVRFVHGLECPFRARPRRR